MPKYFSSYPQTIHSLYTCYTLIVHRVVNVEVTLLSPARALQRGHYTVQPKLTRVYIYLLVEDLGYSSFFYR